MRYTKPQLRKSLQRTRLRLSPEQRAAKSTAIAERLLQEVYWPKNPLVHCFEPIMRLGEVDLVDFVTALQADTEDIKIYTSRKIDGEWRVVLAETDTVVEEVPKFDVVIVPMLGFDPATLQRVGYGGGYYDRFLANQPQAKKIGVCYEAGRTDGLPDEPHDIPLGMIITENRTYGRLS
jgi:5-formyltetrahydrofolate cyclo-ligase